MITPKIRLIILYTTRLKTGKIDWSSELSRQEVIFPRNVAVIYRPSRKCLDIARMIVEVFKKKNISAKSYWVDDILKNIIGTVDLVVAIGGDGTLLKISRLFQINPPLVLPIPCGRRKAFYEDHGLEIRDLIERVLTGEFFVEELARVKISYDNKEFRVLNEAALISRDHGRVIESMIRIETPTFKTKMIVEGDGVLIGPPSGSSAYHLSLGGSLMDYYVQGFFITPLNPMELNIKPVILPPLSKVWVTFTNGYTEVYIDGEKKDIISPGKQVIGELDPHSFRLIRFNGKRDYVREVFEKRTTRFK